MGMLLPTLLLQSCPQRHTPEACEAKARHTGPPTHGSRLSHTNPPQSNPLTMHHCNQSGKLCVNTKPGEGVAMAHSALLPAFQ